MSALRFVTITGADDSTRHEDLVALSCEFPFVEWGLLRSSKREGTSRYPSKAWLERFADAITGKGIRTSHHFCGQLARNIYAGDDSLICNAPAHQTRVQVNGYLDTPTCWANNERSPFELLGQRLSPLELIIQVGGPQTLGTADAMAAFSGNFSALYDPSGGRGLNATWPAPKWVTHLSHHILVGFAGGIGPDNVVSVIEKTAGSHARAFWIDMESNVRTDDKLDLVKVRKVLWLCASLVNDDQPPEQS